MAGFQSIRGIYLACSGPDAITPGMLCREFLIDVADPSTRVVCVDVARGGALSVYTLGELYPLWPLFRGVPREQLLGAAVEFAAGLEWQVRDSRAWFVCVGAAARTHPRFQGRPGRAIAHCCISRCVRVNGVWRPAGPARHARRTCRASWPRCASACATRRGATVTTRCTPCASRRGRCSQTAASSWPRAASSSSTGAAWIL